MIAEKGRGPLLPLLAAQGQGARPAVAYRLSEATLRRGEDGHKAGKEGLERTKGAHAPSGLGCSFSDPWP